MPRLRRVTIDGKSVVYYAASDPMTLSANDSIRWHVRSAETNAPIDDQRYDNIDEARAIARGLNQSLGLPTVPLDS